MGPEECGADVPSSRHEDVVRAAYAAIDVEVSAELDRLQREKATKASCAEGCGACCGYHIPANIAEAHVLARYIQRECSTEQIDALRERTQRWHDASESQRARERTDAVDHVACPLLVDDCCMAYPVRPVVCRAHYVTSTPAWCRARVSLPSGDETPVALASVVEVSRPGAEAIQNHIEAAGIDYSRSIMLLPHALANQMGWSFAL